jgi:hypothetical protein
MSRVCASLALSVGLLLSSSACSDDGAGQEVSAVYVVPASLSELSETTFFDHPFPSDLRVEGGRVRFAGYYNPRQSPILAEYITAIDGVLDGFSPVAAGYLRFDGALDPASLPPTPTAALSPQASVQLIDIDDASPERGARKLVSLFLRTEEGVYWRENTLAFMPAVGHPLRTRTRYALVVTDAVRGAGGGRVGANETLRQALGREAASSPAVEAAHEALRIPVAQLEAAGIVSESIVHLAVFTTNDPAEELYRAADSLHANAEAPVFAANAWSVAGSEPTFDEYQGIYGPSPNFQAGTLPFSAYGDGGGFSLDAQGIPQVVDTFNPRFALTVPNAAACPMPASGYPIVLYAHGTGGDYRSFVRDGTAEALAGECLAAMGVDQIFHGTRPGAPEDAGQVELLFFNFQNVEAARHNIRQSGLDEVQRARLFTESAATVPASASVTGTEIRFDPTKVMFFGHSQGGLNGPLFFAADDAARGGVLSGASSIISITLLEKTSPPPSVASLVKSVFLALNASSADEVNLFHPPIAMAQTIVDVVDPINYAGAAIRDPRPGFAPKSVYMSEGVGPDGSGDTYAPVRGIEALALAYGLPLQNPVVWAPPDASWGGLEPTTVPAEGLAGNLAGGKASGILAQFAPPDGEDGHFVVFDVPQATAQTAKFLRHLADEPAGRVPAP